MLLKQKLILSFFLSFFLNHLSAQGLRNYAPHSALANGQWYKVAITSNGIYKIDYNFIKNNCGFEPSSTTFDKIAVFGNGGGMIPEKNSTFRYDDVQENAVWRVDQNNNGVMDNGDYILFYGQGADKWFFSYSTKLFYHEKNIYADQNYYFLTTTQGTGKTLSVAPLTSTPTTSVNSFTDYAFHEKDDYNLQNSGRRWLGDKMNTYNTSASFSFDFPNRIITDSVQYVSAVNNASIYTTTFSVSVNGQATFSQAVAGVTPSSSYQSTDRASIKRGAFLASGNSLNFTYNYNNIDQTNNSGGYIDYVEIFVTRALTMNSGYLLFRNPNTIGNGNVTQFNITNSNSNVKIWDVSDPINAIQIQSQLNSNTLSFNYATDSIKEFAAVDLYASFENPAFLGEIPNQDLHGMGTIDYIIVTDNSMLSAAENLANFHRTANGLRVAAVDKQAIYNEFSSGKQDISAIRDFMKMFYDRAGNDNSKKPRYLLLLGDASFDYKNRIAGNTNLVPTYESEESSNPLTSYNTDDFFGCLDDNDGGNMGTSQTMEIAVGRLPVNSPDEALAIVEKIKKYKSAEALGEWRNFVTVIGDETSHDGGIAFENQASDLGDYVMNNYPAYNVEKIICDAYRVQNTSGGDRYPDVNEAIINRVNSGALVISYTGHGGVSNLSNARIFNLSDIQQFTNINRLPLFFTATCEFSKFDDPTKKSAGEFLVNNVNGGAIGSVTTVRPVYINQNYALQVALFNRLFQEVNGQKPTMGELLKNAKNDQLSDPVNTRKFALLGDPALTLNYPEYNIVTTSINNNDSLHRDTLSALKRVTIKGKIQDWAGNTLTSFNGVCYPVVYDKLGSFNTLGQVHPYVVRTYNIYKNILFKGVCSVDNGEFEFSFVVPKDINYSIGDGRISYYADNGNNIDAHGYNNDIIIGGTTDSAEVDETGPRVQLFMNDSTFKDGGLTNENPNMFAILEAQGGINTTGNGLGHDITAVLDGETNATIVLNNYYVSALNNYQRGTITYPFSNLSEGRHTLSLKAWDVYNNSAETSIDFIVSSSAQLALMEVMNYPNPVVTTTCFAFEHNKANEELEIVIQIYSAGGQLLKTIQQNITTEGFRSECIEWDGNTDSGSPVGQGVFIYRLQVRDSKGETAMKSDRLVVLK